MEAKLWHGRRRNGGGRWGHRGWSDGAEANEREDRGRWKNGHSRGRSSETTKEEDDDGDDHDGDNGVCDVGSGSGDSERGGGEGRVEDCGQIGHVGKERSEIVRRRFVHHGQLGSDVRKNVRDRTEVGNNR